MVSNKNKYCFVIVIISMLLLISIIIINMFLIIIDLLLRVDGSLFWVVDPRVGENLAA